MNETYLCKVNLDSDCGTCLGGVSSHSALYRQYAGEKRENHSCHCADSAWKVEKQLSISAFY